MIRANLSNSYFWEGKLWACALTKWRRNGAHAQAWIATEDLATETV